MSRYNVLIARIKNELQKISITIQSAISQATKARTTTDEDYWFAAAFSLQNFYMGVERIFEDIAKEIDNNLPKGASSHKLLLEQMALEIPDTRPAVIFRDTLSHLNEYRGFRHVTVHRYVFELNSDRIGELIDTLTETETLLNRDIANFCQFLRQLNQA